MKLEKSDAVAGATLGVFAGVHLADANQFVSLLVGLGTLVALGLRIRDSIKGKNEKD